MTLDDVPAGAGLALDFTTDEDIAGATCTARVRLNFGPAVAGTVTLDAADETGAVKGGVIEIPEAAHDAHGNAFGVFTITKPSLAGSPFVTDFRYRVRRVPPA